MYNYRITVQIDGEQLGYEFTNLVLKADSLFFAYELAKELLVTYFSCDYDYFIISVVRL